MCSNESSGQFLERIETIRHQTTPIITGQHDEMTFTRFRRIGDFEVINNVLYRNVFDGTGKNKCKQTGTPPKTIRQISQSLHDDPLQGHPDCNKMLHELRKRYYSPKLSELVLQNVLNCQDCFRSKPIRKAAITPPLQQIYGPCNGPEDILESDLVGELPPSNGFTHVLTACDCFSRYLFAIPIRKPDTKSVVEAVMRNLTQHPYAPKTILTDK